MMIWIGLILLICAGFSAYAGASQLEQAKQRAKCSLDAFTERRNGVSCICLSVLFVILGVAINLWQYISPKPFYFFQSLSDGFAAAPHRRSSPWAVLKDSVQKECFPQGLIIRQIPCAAYVPSDADVPENFSL